MADRYWAVGFKGWVEVRSHPNPPEAVKSILETEVEHRTIDYDSYYRALDRGERNVTPKVTITKKIKEFPCTFYDGGKVIKTLTANKFYRATGISVGNGHMVELNDTSVAAVKKTRGYGNAGR